MNTRMIKYLPVLGSFLLIPAVPATAAVSGDANFYNIDSGFAVFVARNGADDAVNHDAGDDRGRGGHGRDGRSVEHASSGVLMARHGEDDPAGHDVGDDRGRGGDDPVGHDAGEDRRHGGDDPVGHDAGDDRGRGGHGRDDRKVMDTYIKIQQARGGADDPAGHNAGDDRGRHRG